MEFFKASWNLLVQVFIAFIGGLLAGLLSNYYIYRKERSEREKTKLEDIISRIAKVEGRIETLLALYPKLSEADKLLKKIDEDDLKNPEDIRRIVSEVLKKTNITPEAIEGRIEEKVKEKFSDIDKAIATIVAQKIDEIDKRFEKPVGDAFDYLRLGNAEYFKGNYSKAIEYYDKAIEIKPDDAEAWCNKGAVLYKLGRYEEALKSIDKAIEINPDFANAWYGKACIYSLKREKESALKSLKKAIELDPNYKEKAKEDFKNLWDDEGFRRIVE